MKCILYERKNGCSCYEAPLLRLRQHGEAWGDLKAASGQWLWRYEAPNQPPKGSPLQILASSLRPLVDADRAEFERVIAEYDESAYEGPSIELLLLKEPEWPLSATSLAREFVRFDAGLQSKIGAYIVTLQDQTCSITYFSQELRPWINQLLASTCGGQYKEKSYANLRLQLSEMLPLTDER